MSSRSSTILSVLALGLGAALGARWLVPAQPVQAEMVSQVGEYVALTTDAGNEELLALIDNRSGDLLLYRVEKQSSVELYRRYSLSKLFTDARAASGARPR